MKVHDNRLLTEKVDGDNPLVLVMVNGSLGGMKTFEHLWESSALTICADGGANRLYAETFDEKLVQSTKYVPTFIKGDCDSIQPAILEHYKKHGTKIVVDKSQETNDLAKCFQLVEEMQKDQKEQFNVVVIGAMGGRFDHEMQNINALYSWTKCFNRILLLSDQTLVTLLTLGKNVIVPNFALEKRTCGIIPVGSKCKSITTKGLHWNLNQNSMEFGGIISSSNHIEGDRVEIETSDPVIWTTAL